MRDEWSEWLLHRRHGGNVHELDQTLTYLSPIRDRVLANAQMGSNSNETLLDIGTGDGKIAFKALEHVGDKGTVVFTDVSQVLLDHCSNLAKRMGVSSKCRFLRASADDLSAVESGSVDMATIRSVLIYVSAKQSAF